MNTTVLALIGILVLLVLLLLGMDIGIAMLMVGSIGYFICAGLSGTIGMLRATPATTASTYSFCVIPLFVMMGNFVFAAGLSDDLFDAGNKFLGRLPGGLACASIAACACFGAICGSTTATAATMGVVAVPAMRKYGYSSKLATGTVSVGGTLGIMIPPSTPLIIYGIMAEESIGKLFAAGVIPGIMLAVLLMATIVILVKIDPSLAPDTNQHFTAKERLKSLKGLIWVVIIFGIVLGGIFSGIFTVNEAAAIGALVGLIIMIIRGRFTWKAFGKVMKDSVITTAMCFIILIGADVFGKFLTISNLVSAVADFAASLPLSRYLILFFIALIYVILGCFMDSLPMITLTVPIFYPVITELGFDGIWFGILIILVMELGLITPPVGMNCYVISGVIKDVPLKDVFLGSLPFIPAILIAIVLIVLFPQLATWLPSIMAG